jgi:hypothetical protein
MNYARKISHVKSLLGDCVAARKWFQSVLKDPSVPRPSKAIKTQYPEAYSFIKEHLTEVGPSIRIVFSFLAATAVHTPKCRVCGVFVFKMLTPVEKGVVQFCGPSCSKLDPEVRRRTDRTVMARHGGYTLASAEGKKKYTATNKRRYGGHPRSNPIVLAKAKATLLRRHGVTNPSRIPEAQRKKVLTFLERYGYRNPSQSPLIQRKILRNSFKTKIYHNRQGRKLLLQGYEPLASKLLEDSGFKVYQPNFSVRYYHKGNSHVYHPDLIAVKGGRKYIVEVKSTYTITSDFVLAKYKATLKKVARSSHEYEDYIVLLLDEHRLLTLFRGNTGLDKLRNYLRP